jgi:hypothetical protein
MNCSSQTELIFFFLMANKNHLKKIKNLVLVKSFETFRGSKSEANWLVWGFVE